MLTNENAKQADSQADKQTSRQADKQTLKNKKHKHFFQSLFRAECRHQVDPVVVIEFNIWLTVRTIRPRTGKSAITHPDCV
jgi:hypothetical protein